ncbi:PLDc N-terminal domain-containing protein [Conyzicola sp.]|uniref:PLD nuclease N-terminal domain-containing protein n=1 Tax=Conyzicola sp. TaxID=1969404 RepID=UPI0039899C50
MSLVIPILVLALIVGALVDIITRPEGEAKHLPKIGWILLVVFLPLIGSIVWFVVGHDYAPQREYISFGDPSRHEPKPAERGFRTTEQELADLEAEIEFHEKQARIDRLEAEIVDRRDRISD